MEILKSNKKLKRISAFILAVVLVLASIPVNGFITSRVKADDSSTETGSDFVIKVNSILGPNDGSTEQNPDNEISPLAGADVTITATITVTTTTTDNSENAGGSTGTGTGENQGDNTGSQNSGDAQNDSNQTPVITTADKTVTVTGKTDNNGQYIVSENDLKKLKGEVVEADSSTEAGSTAGSSTEGSGNTTSTVTGTNTSGKVTVNTSKDGYKFESQEVELSRIGSDNSAQESGADSTQDKINADNPLTINGTPDCFGATITLKSGLKYTGEEQDLIESVTFNDNDIAEKDTGEKDSNGNAIYSATTYKTEYSTTSATDGYREDIPIGTDAKVYPVYIKVTKTVETYTKTDNSENTQQQENAAEGSNSGDTTVTKNSLGSTTAESVKKVLVTIGKDTDTFTLDFYKENETDKADLTGGVNVTWGDSVTYTAKSEKAANATISYEVKADGTTASEGSETSSSISEEIAIDNNGKVTTTKKAAGKSYKVIATMTSIGDNKYKDDNYQLHVAEYTIHVTAKSETETGYAFEYGDKVTTIYKDGLTYTNVYKYTGEETVENTPDGPSVTEYKITEQYDADGNLLNISGSDDVNSENTASDDGSSTATGSDNTSASQSPVAVIEENNKTTGTLTIKRAGKVVVEAVISDEDKAAYGLTANPSYTLTIGRAEAKIMFTEADQTIQFGETPTKKEATIDKDKCDKNVINTITYSIQSTGTPFITDKTSDSEGSESEDTKPIATIDESTGIVTVNGVGTITVTATMPATDRYQEATAAYTITVGQADVSLVYNELSKELNYSSKLSTYNQSVVIKDKSENAITDTAVLNYINKNIAYSADADYDTKGFASDAVNSSTGEVTLPAGEGQIKVIAALQNNPFYKYKDGTSQASYELKQTIMTQPENKADSDYYSTEVTGTEGTSTTIKPNDAGWYNKDNIVLKAKPGYKIAKESKETDIATYAADDTTNSSEVTAGNLTFKDSVTISKSDLNSNRQIQLYYLDNSGNIIKSKVQTFKIDDTEPDIQIEYVKGTFYEQVIEKLKSLISGNTNQSSAVNKRVVAVKISAKDTDSDIDTNSIKAVLNNGSDNIDLTPNTDGVKTEKDDNGNEIYYRTFTIPSEQRGNITYSAANNAGLTAKKTDNVYTVIADDTAPVIEDEIVKYKGDTSSSTEYKKTLNIKVTEKNFDNTSDFVMTIKKKVSSNAEDVESTVNGDSLKWTHDSSNIALYSTSYDFKEDGIYEVSYSYKDPSENQAVVKDSSANKPIGEYVHKFIVDTTAPIVDIALKDGEQSINAGNYATSTDGVTAEITIKEATGFDVNDIDVTLTADKLQGVDTVQVYDNGTGQYKDTTISALTSLLNSSSGSTQDSNNYWRQDEKDSTKYKAVIKLVSDAKYEIKAAAKDKYNNDGGSTTASVIYDKTAPSVLKAEMTPAGTQGDNKYGDVIFYDNGTKSVTISLSADDKVSEIDHFEYWEEGSDAKHTVNADNNGEYNIVISSDYNKSITYKAVDKAGNVSEKATTPKIIIDSKAPVLNVDYVKTQRSEVTSDSYSDNVNMNITLTEDNYYNDGNESFVIDAKYTPYGENQTAKYISAEMKNAINMQKNSSGEYTGSYQFTKEGKYDISIKYVDKSGNESQISEKTFEIDKAKPEVSIKLQDEHGNAISTYTKDDVYAVVTVKEKAQFNKNKVKFNYSGKDIDGNNLHPALEVIGTEWESSTVDGESIYTNKYKFSTEAVYNFDVTYTGVSGLVSDKKEAVTTYDKTAPADLSIKYNTTEKTVNDGNRYFDTNDIKVTLSASDEISGIKSFEYSTDGSEWITKNVTELSKKNNNKLYEAIITLPDEYSGTIKFKATDKAGNEAQQVTDNVVKDTINPVIKAGLTDSDNNRITLDTGKLTYVNKDITADIAITEKNFNADKTTVTISKTNTKDKNNYPDSTERINGDEFTLENGKYIKNITFDKEYEYTITVNTTDYSGNSASYTGKFVLDKTNPEVTVDFNNDSARNDKYAEWYQGDRKATIIVNDHNFNKDGMSIVVTETNGIQNKKAENYYLNQWKENVKDSGDYHTGNIIFDNEAEYSIAVVYTDLAGNKNTVAVYKNGEKSEQLTSKIFAIDKTDPVIKVNYTQNNGKEPVSGDHYTSNVTASIQITEHNFKPEDVKNCFNMTVMYQPYQGVKTDDITDKIKNSLDFTNKEGTDEWNTSFELRQGEADDNIDGKYTISYSYTDQSGRKVEIPEKVFYIDKTDPGVEINLTDTDGKQLTGDVYSQKEIISEIVIDENAAFNPSNVKTELKSSDDTGNTVDNVQLQVYVSDTDEWKKLDSLDKLKDYWKNDGRKHTVKVKYITEAGYVLSVVYKNDSDRDDNKEKSFTYDKTMPGGLSITYDQIPENTTHGYKFYNENDVNVTLTAKDRVSGVDYFKYSKDNGNTWNSVKLSDIKIDKSGDEKVYTYGFKIDAQYKDTIRFEAVDKAKNTNETADSIIVDTEKPVITVQYINDTQPGVYDNHTYYQSTRQARVYITENNFYDENMYVEVNGVLNDGTVKNYAKYNGSGFELVNGTNNLWQSKELIDMSDDADYALYVAARDYSNNIADNRYEDFTVDTINPDISIDFHGDTSAIASNVDQFKNNRTATVTFTEHNFNADDINVLVTENGNDVSAQYKQALLSTLNTLGDVYQGSITFSNEMNYTFAISYTDKAGRGNNDIVYANGSMTADLARLTSNRFTVDKTAPQIGMTMSGKIADEEEAWSRQWNNETGADGFYQAPDGGVNFGLWSRDNVNVNITDNDNLSGIEKTGYYITSSAVTGTAQLAGLADDAWTDFADVSGGQVTLTPNSKSIVYVRVIDRAGNISYMSSSGVIVDNIAPTGDMDAPEIFISTGQQKVNDLYNSSVTLDVSAYDPTAGDLDGRDFYSGIRSVTYRISADDTGAEETGTLFTGATDEFNNVTQRMNSSIVVDGDTFNSNEVSVEVTVIDNSGNANYGTMKLQIDTTNPSVLVTYDNNNGDTEFGDRAYFKEERTAIVDITERNFDESAVEMTINAKDGAAPEISGWQQIPGSSANSDDTIYRATVRYYADGDYTFDIAFTDKSGNAAPEETYEGQSPTEFTVDMTNPVISVAYDNNAAVNGNYYNEARTATVTIEEHNFEPGRVVSTLTTEGGTAAVPQLSDWSTAGDTHTATVTYAGDTLYSFDLKYTDMAGNQAEDINVDNFYVDVTAPELSIENVESSQAYKDELVRPSVVYSDQYFDSVEITLTGAEHGSLNIDGMGGYASDENGGSFTFDNIPEDDIYTLSATVVDKAGNQTEQSVEFSVNRDGSTYSLDEETESLNGSYVASAKNVVIREVNPDELIEHKLTLFKNDKTVALTEGSDYSVDVSGGNGQWYQYVYTVYSKNFEDDGVYRLTVHSVDKAGNIAENVIDGKDKEITFGVDATAPNIIMMNLESGTTYPTDNLEAAMAVSDNLKLNSVEVYLDNRLEKSWNIDDIKALRDQDEDFTFYISGDSTGAHNVSVIAIDAAGNEQRNEITDFYVTTNLWIRFYTNPFVLWGTVGGIAIVAAGASFVIFRKRKLKISK